MKQMKLPKRKSGMYRPWQGWDLRQDSRIRPRQRVLLDTCQSILSKLDFVALGMMIRVSLQDLQSFDNGRTGGRNERGHLLGMNFQSACM